MATYKSNFSSLSQYTLRVVATEASTNASNNTSSVNVKMYIDKRSGTGYWFNENFSAYIEVNGSRQNYTIKGYDFRGRSTIKIAERTVTVSHNSDGSKNCSIKGHVNTSRSGYTTLGSATASGTLGLTKFNRKGYIREYTLEVNLHGANGFRLHERSKGLTYRISLQKRDGSRTYQDWTIRPGWNNISVTQGVRNTIYNDFTGTGEFLLRFRLYSFSGSTSVGTTDYYFQTRPRGVSFTNSSSITLGGMGSVYFTKHHTDARFEYGLCYRHGGAWLPGYPKVTSDTSGTLATASENLKEAILRINPNGSYADVGVWVKQMNSKGRNLGTAERNVRINFVSMSVDFTISRIRRKKADIVPSFSSVTTSISSVQYQVNGGSWQNGVNGRNTLSNLREGANNTVRVRAQQKGSNTWVYSSTKSFKTIGSSTLEVVFGGQYVGDPFKVTAYSPEGTSGTLKITNGAGRVIHNESGLTGTVVRNLSYGYKDLIYRPTNTHDYGDVLDIVFTNKDSDGVESVNKAGLYYKGHPLPTSRITPLKTTSQGGFSVIVKDVLPNYEVSVKATLKGKSDKVLLEQTFTGNKTISYVFKESDFDDAFEESNLENVRVEVSAADRGSSVTHYRDSFNLVVEQHSEVFVRHKDQWKKIDEIHTMQTGVGKILYPYIFNYPGKETYPRADVAAKAKVSQNTYVYLDKWVRII